MGTIKWSQPASKSSWDSQDFGDISVVLKMAHFRKSTGPRWVNNYIHHDVWDEITYPFPNFNSAPLKFGMVQVSRLG